MKHGKNHSMISFATFRKIKMNAFISWQVLINDALNDDVVKKYNFSYSCLFSQF